MNRASMVLRATLVGVTLSMSTAVARAQERPYERDPMPRPTAWWMAAQLVPASMVVMGAGQVSYGLRWTVAPVLYSWGIRRGLNPWRAFVAEPNVRHQGSIELFLSPELIFAQPLTALIRPGIRAFVPLLEHGELLSASLAVSFQYVAPSASPAFELGVHGFYGILGVYYAYAPLGSTLAQHSIAIGLRYF